MNVIELAVFCDGGKEPIADGQGQLWIDRAEISRYEEAVRKDVPSDEYVALTYEQLLALPEVARWRAHHGDCHPKPSAYGFDVARLRRWSDLVSLTAHLMGRNWLGSTDWQKVLDAAARGDGTPIRQVG